MFSSKIFQLLDAISGTRDLFISHFKLYVEKLKERSLRIVVVL